MSTIDIAVLDHDAHGIPAADYAEILTRRLPDREVRLAATPDEHRRYLREATVVAGKYIDAEEAATAENLRLFACNAAGVDHLPLDALAERGVAVVTNASGVHGPNIAEHVLGWVLTFARRLDEGDADSGAESAASSRSPNSPAAPSPSSGSGPSARRSSSGSRDSTSTRSASATRRRRAGRRTRWSATTTSLRCCRGRTCSSSHAR